MPIVINETRAQILAFKVGERIRIDFFGELKSVIIEAIEPDTIEVRDDDNNLDTIANSDVNLVLEVPNLPPSSGTASARALEKLLCFNLINLSSYQLSNTKSGQVAITLRTAAYEYSPGTGIAANSSPPLGGSVCSPPPNYVGAAAPIAVANAGMPSYTVSSAGVLTSRVATGNPFSTIVLEPAPDSHKVNGTPFIPLYTEAPCETNVTASILET